MSNFFEDLGKKLGETAGSVSSFATETVELQKIKHNIRNLARSNSYDLEDLGKAVYQSYIDGSLEDETATELCSAIQEREEQIAEFHKKIAIIKGEQTCTVCGNLVAKGMAYCPFCGNKMPDFPEDTVVTEEEVVAEEATAEAVEPEADATETVTGDVEGEPKPSSDKMDEVLEKAKDIAVQAAELAAAAADRASVKFHDFVNKADEKGQAAEPKVEPTDAPAESTDDSAE